MRTKMVENAGIFFEMLIYPLPEGPSSCSKTHLDIKFDRKFFKLSKLCWISAEKKSGAIFWDTLYNFLEDLKTFQKSLNIVSEKLKKTKYEFLETSFFR